MNRLAQTALSAENSTTSAAYRRDVHTIVLNERPDLYAYWQQVKPQQVQQGYLPDACTHTGTRTNGRLGVRWNRDTQRLDILPDGYAARLHERYQRTPGGLYAVTVPLHTVSRFDRGQDWQQAAQLVQEVGRELSPETEIECTAEVSSAWMLHGHYITDITAAVRAMNAGFSVEQIEALGLLDIGGYQVKPVQGVNCGHNSEEGWRYAATDKAAQGVMNVLSVQQEQGYLPRMRATLSRGKVSAPVSVFMPLHNLRPAIVTTPPSQQQPNTPTPISNPIDHRHRHRVTALLSSERVVKVTRPNRATRRTTRSSSHRSKVKPQRSGPIHGDKQHRQQQPLKLEAAHGHIKHLEHHAANLDPPTRQQHVSSDTSSNRAA